MKKFLHDYSYCIVKMFIYQFAISIFGAMLSMATNAVRNNTLSIVASILSVLFYLFLLYTMTWEIGAKDRISVDAGKKKRNLNLGLLLSLFANIPNFLIAIIYTAVSPFMGAHEWAGNINAAIKLLSLLFEGMYTGITSKITLNVGGTVYALHYFWWSYFLIIIPALATAWLAYYSGYRNTRFGAMFTGPKKKK